MMWAVSQAAPLRRISIEGDLCLHDQGMFASGGYASSMFVKGVVDFGSQQQWIMCNSTVKNGFINGAWNFVFVGVDGAPESRMKTATQAAYTNINATPVIAEKPYIFVDTEGRYYLQVPPVRRLSTGVPYEGVGVTIDFEEVFVANDSHSTEEIQNMIDAGAHIVFSPGIYYLDKALSLKRNDQVLLGIGMATLVAAKDGCLKIANGVSGVRIAGLMLQAASPVSEVLLQCGTSVISDDSGSTAPIVLSDIFVRVGGPLPRDVSTPRTSIGARSMVEVHASQVIGDNLW